MAITIDDFSKIWASTSPLTPYEFSENNYKQGWDFVGGTPPSRQMWDFLQKNNDEKMQYLANNYLPLSGGTMTGAIKGNPITLTADDGNGNTKSFVANADGTLTWANKAVIVGTEATETFSNVAVSGGSTATVTLAHEAKYYSVFAEGTGFAQCSFVLSSNKKTLWIANFSSVARTIEITVNYIY